MPDETSTPNAPARVVLGQVPRIGFSLGAGICPESFPFTSCLRACLEYLGAEQDYGEIQAHGKAWRLNHSYAHLVGTSGMAFRLLWNSREWDHGNCGVLIMAADRDEPFRRAFEAAGYSFEILMTEDGRDEEELRSRIIENISHRGRPVIAFGVVGPPECAIITGYDDNADALIGWSYFQDFPDFNPGIEFEESGYFHMHDWSKATPGIIIIGDKKEKPPLEDVYRKALTWALDIARTPMINHFHNGFAAYKAWAECISRDDEFPTDDMNMLRERHMVHDDAVGTVAEGRWYGAQFLKRIAEHQPAMAENLLAAARLYEAEHDLMWKIWGLEGGLYRTDENVRKLAEPEVRREMIPIIHEALANDEEAAGYIDRALAR